MSKPNRRDAERPEYINTMCAKAVSEKNIQRKINKQSNSVREAFGRCTQATDEESRQTSKCQWNLTIRISDVIVRNNFEIPFLACTVCLIHEYKESYSLTKSQHVSYRESTVPQMELIQKL